jgi:hypothetical protein
MTAGAHPTGGGLGLPSCGPTNPQKSDFFKKNLDFVDIVISRVLRNFPFSRNKQLKSADEQYIKILKSK